MRASACHRLSRDERSSVAQHGLGKRRSFAGVVRNVNLTLLWEEWSMSREAAVQSMHATTSERWPDWAEMVEELPT